MKQTDDVSNVIQGTLWQNIMNKYSDKTIFPLIIYFDDLSTHAGINKIGAVYFTIPCLPPEYSALLENIFLLQLHYSTDRNVFGNYCIFKYIIRDLIYLSENGITVKTAEGQSKIYFNLVTIVGDNLGLNSICC